MSEEGRYELTAIITAKPGKRAELKAALQLLVAETVKEPGCIEFRIFENVEDAQKFVLWEVFVNRQALRDHLALPYTQAYFASGLMESTEVLKLRSF